MCIYINYQLEESCCCSGVGGLEYYFFSLSTAQLSGNEGEDLDYEQIEALLHSERRDPLTRAKKAIYRLVKKVGFFGILLCASVSLLNGV